MSIISHIPVVSSAAFQPQQELLSAMDFRAQVFHQAGPKQPLERIELQEKPPGLLGQQRAVVIDISLSGALVEHENQLQRGQTVPLSFSWRGDQINVECEVARTELHRAFPISGKKSRYRSGLAFRHHRSGSQPALRAMITELVERALDERKANARGVPPLAASCMMTGKIRGFLRFRLIHDTWQRVASGDPLQPSDGFTVSIDEDPGQIQLLCEAYQKLTEADRELVRRMAALSVSHTEGIPARRYEP